MWLAENIIKIPNSMEGRNVFQKFRLEVQSSSDYMIPSVF